MDWLQFNDPKKYVLEPLSYYYMIDKFYLLFIDLQKPIQPIIEREEEQFIMNCEFHVN